MNKEIYRNIRLGVFVIAGAALLIFGLYSIGKSKSMFGKTFILSCEFSDVNGLAVGNNVRYSGIDVGTVDKIEFANDSTIKVDMLIDDNFKKYIRANSIASIGTDGLMGNKLVSIAPGSSDVPLVENLSVIRSIKIVNTEEMLRTLDNTNNNISTITKNLKEITDNVNRSRGTLYTILMDTMLASDVEKTLRNIQYVSRNLVETSGQLSDITKDANSGKGVFGVMLNDSVLSNDLRQAILNIKNGSEKFSQITNDVTLITDQINNGKGVMNSLLADSLMTKDLRKALSNIESASKKLDEDLEGLKHSIFLRSYFRKKEQQKNDK
ncbi:MAG: MCE family protein [Bacteroidia bacterium]|nr:MCE family protein [Bacteroidia bacterium]